LAFYVLIIAAETSGVIYTEVRCMYAIRQCSTTEPITQAQCILVHLENAVSLLKAT